MSEEVESSLSDDGLPDKLFFRIGEAAQLVGVEPHVLRYWEAEFDLRPTRSPSGQRMFRREDISTLLAIRRLLHDEGFTIAGARKALSDGADPAASASGPEAFQALGRLSAARKRIADLRQRVMRGSAREASTDP